MKAFKETAAAVQVEIRFDVPSVEKSASRIVWVPKSQIRNGRLTEWIFGQKLDAIQQEFRTEVCDAAAYDANGDRIGIEETERTRKVNARFNALMNKAFKRS